MIAIYNRKGSFSDRWIQFCRSQNISFLEIDIFDSDLIKKVKENKVNYVLFHFGTGQHTTHLFLKNLTYLLESNGIKVFPNHTSYWHYDDKLGQKYLFEQLDLPHVPMHVSYTREDALDWVKTVVYPLVFKLRVGAGSNNVRLLHNHRVAIKMVDRMFGRGIYPVRSILSDISTKIRKHNKERDWRKVLLRFPLTIMRNLKANDLLPVEKGYFLTQEYCPDNQYDTRIAIVGEKAIAFRRHNRPGDFRASGSGLIDLDQSQIDLDMIHIAFRAADKIKGTSLAFDFLYDKNREPKIIEVSNVYVADALPRAGGYWDKSLVYHNSPVQPEDEIIIQLLAS